jgi:predicted metal-dependent enzyme (double-stranded beta helix superfamily)
MFQLETFVADCQAAVSGSTAEAAVKELVERAVAQPTAVERALGTPEFGGITTLHRSPDCTILNVVWAPGMAIVPHDHRMWAVIGIYGGREDNTFYRRGSTGVAPAGGKRLDRSDVALLGKTIVHSVANPLRRFTGAIHVYGGDFFATPRSEFYPATLVEKPYDVEHTKRAFAEANERWRAECAAAASANG